MNSTISNTTTNEVKKQISNTINNLIQIPIDQLQLAFPQTMTGFKIAYDKNGQLNPLKFVKTLTKKLKIQTQWPVFDFKEKGCLYNEGFDFNYIYLTTDGKILTTFDMFIIISQITQYNFTPIYPSEIESLIPKLISIDWILNQNPPPPIERPTKRKTTKRTSPKKETVKKQSTDDTTADSIKEEGETQVEPKPKRQRKTAEPKITNSKTNEPKTADTKTTNTTQKKPQTKRTSKRSQKEVLEQLQQNTQNTNDTQNVSGVEQQQIDNFKNAVEQHQKELERSTSENINQLLQIEDEPKEESATLEENELGDLKTMGALNFDAL